MNHYVPDFEIVEEDLNLNPTSSGLPRQEKSKLHLNSTEEEEIVDLVWQNDQVVFHSQISPPKKSSQKDADLEARSCAAAAEEGASRYHLFMQDQDQMVSWIHQPYHLEDSFDRDFCTDLLYNSPLRNFSDSIRVTQFQEENKTPSAAAAAPAPAPAPRLQPAAATVIDSNVTAGGELAGTSSSGGSGASAEQFVRLPKSDRKRKGIEADDADWHGEDMESVNAKKQAQARRGSRSTRRPRAAAEVHNLSERRRRDRINEKMKALQELIPRCNKSDKASMLDEAIEYLKSLQLQVQMMSMGCSMVPMMFPGVQQYMPQMGMGMGMGMQMGMDMGMNRPLLPFPLMLAGSGMPNPAAAAHLCQSLPLSPYHLRAVSTPDLSRMQALNQSDPAINSIGVQSLNQQQVPSSAPITTVPWPPPDADSSHGPAKHQQGS